MKNYDKLKKIIQEANPEIMKLKFGCILDFAGYKKMLLSTTNDLMASIKILDLEQFEIEVTTASIVNVNVVEIIGRPIKLADVLLAIENKDKKGRNGIQDYIDIIAIWNLKDDNLENQSDETKKFLIDLLTK